MIVRILVAVLIFGFVVVFHELGHFLLAKANGIVVTEFAVGFGPTLLSTEKGGTVYALKLLPFGGSCAMLGEDSDEEGEGTFNSKSVWARISVVAAGPFFNLLLAFLISIIVISYAGSSPARVTEVADGSPEAAAGLMKGDEIVRFEGRRIFLGKELDSYLALHSLPTDEITLTYRRDGKKQTITYVPYQTTQYRLGFSYYQTEEPAEITSLEHGMPLEEAGVALGDVITAIDDHAVATGEELSGYLKEHPLSGQEVTLSYEHNGRQKEAVLVPVENTYASLGFGFLLREELAPAAVLKYSVLEIRYWIGTVLDSIGMLITGQYSVNDLSGPVGVADAIGTVYEDVRSEGFLVTLMTMLNMVVLLSANLGVMNLLPLPALDGGRLIFLLIEAVRRKPVKRDVEGMIHFAGLVLLMALMVYVLIHDVQRIF